MGRIDGVHYCQGVMELNDFLNTCFVGFFFSNEGDWKLDLNKVLSQDYVSLSSFFFAKVKNGTSARVFFYTFARNTAHLQGLKKAHEVKNKN